MEFDSRELGSAKAQDFFSRWGDLEAVLLAAKETASNQWEEDFISSQIEKAADWGLGMFMSPKQFVKLILIAARKQEDDTEDGLAME